MTSSLAGELGDETYDAFRTAAWNREWVAPVRFIAAQLDCRLQPARAALENLDIALLAGPLHPQGLDLRALVLLERGRAAEVQSYHGENAAAIDRLHELQEADPKRAFDPRPDAVASSDEYGEAIRTSGPEKSSGPGGNSGPGRVTRQPWRRAPRHPRPHHLASHGQREDNCGGRAQAR